MNNYNIQDLQDSFFLIAGPCVIENSTTPFEIAEAVKSICESHSLPFIFKASFKKANRTSIHSFTGIGDQEAINILAEIKSKLDIPITTDVHSVEDVEKVKDIIDVIQIPAFLCRQTDLLLAAGKSGKIVNIKKGQFLSPESMAFAVQKVKETGNQNVWLTERGTTFGYQDLVVDMRSIPKMQKNKVPVIMDCTHSLQQPNQNSGVTGGDPDMISTIANAATAVGANGLFIETHPNPQDAKSDGKNMLPLDDLSKVLEKVLKIKKAIS